MKKSSIAVGAIIVAGLAYVGTSWYIGKRAQDTVERVVEGANHRLLGMLGPDLGGRGIKVEIVDYKRGVFSSDASYVLRMKDAEGKDLDVKLNDHLQHGPFPLTALRAGRFVPMLAYSQATLARSPALQLWFDGVQEGAPVQIATRVGFDGTGHSLWRFQPVDIQYDDRKVQFSGGEITMDFSNDFNDTVAVGRFTSFKTQVGQTGEGVDVGDMQIHTSTLTGGDGSVKMQSSATIDRIAAIEADADPVKVRNMQVNVESVQKGALLDGSLRYDFGDIVVGGTPLGAISIGLSGKQLDTTAIAAVTSEYNLIRVRHGAAADEDFELTDAEVDLMLEKLTAALSSNPSVSLDPFLWKNDHGQSQLSLRVDFSKPSDLVKARSSADELLAQMLQFVKLNISISRPMFIQAFSQANAGDKQQAEMLAMLIFDQYAARLQQLGLVKIEGDTADATVQYQDRAIDLNGQKMSVPEFTERVMGAAM
jgi:uncharacterized protein YdgA (DUF945 family)